MSTLKKQLKNKMKYLQLSLKKQWFEMTDTNGKTEDYRNITPFWLKRLCLWQNEKITINLRTSDILECCEQLLGCYDEEDIAYQIDNWYLSFKPFTHNIMTLGYPKSTDISRIKIFKHAGIEIGFGKEEWGAEPNKLYFIIKHGKRIQ